MLQTRNESKKGPILCRLSKSKPSTLQQVLDPGKCERHPRSQKSSVVLADRRDSARAVVQAVVECEAHGCRVTGECENISESGLLIRSNGTFARLTGVLVRISFTTDLNLYIEVRGIVMHVQTGSVMGIRFFGLNERSRVKIAELAGQQSTAAKHRQPTEKLP